MSTDDRRVWGMLPESRARRFAKAGNTERAIELTSNELAGAMCKAFELLSSILVSVPDEQLAAVVAKANKQHAGHPTYELPAEHVDMLCPLRPLRIEARPLRRVVPIPSPKPRRPALRLVRSDEAGE